MPEVGQKTSGRQALHIATDVLASYVYIRDYPGLVQAVAFAKERSRILPGGYFPNALVYSGQMEESRILPPSPLSLFDR